jgi:hypothetical protein
VTRRQGLLAAGLGTALLVFGGPGQTQTANGTIEGSIGYPSEEIPAMHIYAIPLDGGGSARKIETRRSQTSFSIPGLPAGRYHVIAYPVGEGEGGMAGGWTVFVTCGMTAQCLQHDLLPVTVLAGKVTGGIRLEDWYGSADSFPPEATLAP